MIDTICKLIKGRVIFMWIVYAFLSALFAGITAILAKIGIQNIDSHLATALRTIVVVIFAWAMVFIAGSQNTLPEIQTKSLLFLILSGLSTGASWICYFRALQLGNINKVVPIDKSSVLLTMLLAIFFLHEPISVSKVLSMAAIAIGTYLMIQRQESDMGETSSKAWLIYAVLSAVFAAATSILAKIGIENVESNLGTAIRTVVVLILAWAIVFAQGKQRDIKKIDRKSALFIVLSGFATGLSWLFYYQALQKGQASIVAPIDKLSIVITIVFSRVVLKEKVPTRALIGFLLLVGGTMLLLVNF